MKTNCIYNYIENKTKSKFVFEPTILNGLRKKHLSSVGNERKVVWLHSLFNSALLSGNIYNGRKG